MISNKNKRGITLVELLMAVLMFGIAMMPIYWIFYSATRTSNLCYSKMVNTLVASDMIERMLATPSTRIASDVEYNLGEYIEGGTDPAPTTTTARTAYAEYAKKTTIKMGYATGAKQVDGFDIFDPPSGSTVLIYYISVYNNLSVKGGALGKEVLCTYVRN